MLQIAEIDQDLAVLILTSDKRVNQLPPGNTRSANSSISLYLHYLIFSLAWKSEVRQIFFQFY